jgi:hypothetical protein
MWRNAMGDKSPKDKQRKKDQKVAVKSGKAAKPAVAVAVDQVKKKSG